MGGAAFIGKDDELSFKHAEFELPGQLGRDVCGQVRVPPERGLNKDS